MHGAELPYQVLQFLPTHMSLGDQEVQEVPEFLELMLWESDCPCLGVDDTPEDLLYALPTPLSG